MGCHGRGRDRLGWSIHRAEARRLSLRRQPRDSLARCRYSGRILSSELDWNERAVAQSWCPHLKNLSHRQLFQKRLAFSEPRPFHSLHVARQRPLLDQELLRPLTSLVAAILQPQKVGIVVECFWSGRKLCDLGKVRGGAFELAGARVRIGKQSRRAVVIELGVNPHHVFEIGNRTRKIAKAQIALRAVIKRVRRVAARRNSLVKSGARLRKLFLFQAEFAQFLVIPSGRIVDNLYFQGLDARPAAESLEHAAKKARVRQHFHHYVHARAQESSEEDYIQPIALRATARKVHPRHTLYQESPGVEELSESEHRMTAQLTESIFRPPESNRTLRPYR